MKKGTLKRLVGLLLSLIMVLSMASFATAEETTTLSWLCTSNWMNLGEGIHTDKNPVLQYIKDELGIEIEWVIVDNDKYNALIAGGDLPDIVSIPGRTNDLVAGGQLLGLNALLESNGQNILKKNAVGIAAMRAVLGGEEKECYVLPITVSDVNYNMPSTTGSHGLKFRYDIYEAVGCPSVATEDDLLAALKMMQDYERERTGSDDVYALHWWGQGASSTPQVLSYMYGVSDGPFSLHIDEETGEYSYWYHPDSVYIKVLRFYNKAWALGIMDPDSFTMDATTWLEKIKNGKVLTAPTSGDQPDPAICGEYAILTNLPGPFPYLPGVYGSASPVGGGYLGTPRAISTNCKNPEKAMELLNWLDSDLGMRVIYNGVPGKDWDYVDGVPQYIGEAKAAKEAGTLTDYLNENTMRGTYAADIMCTGYNTTSDDGYSIRLDSTLESRKANATVAQKNFASKFGEDLFYQGQVYDLWIKEGIAKTTSTSTKVALIKAYMPVISDDVLSETLWVPNGLWYENAAEICMASPEEFDEWVEKLWQCAVDNGAEEVLEQIQQNYEETKAFVEAMLGE